MLTGPGAAVVVFPRGVREICTACGRPTVTHWLNARWVGCQSRDPVIGRDTETLARRLRLAQLQTRVLKVRPFGIDVEGE